MAFVCCSMWLLFVRRCTFFFHPPFLWRFFLPFFHDLPCRFACLATRAQLSTASLVCRAIDGRVKGRTGPLARRPRLSLPRPPPCWLFPLPRTHLRTHTRTGPLCVRAHGGRRWPHVFCLADAGTAVPLLLNDALTGLCSRLGATGCKSRLVPPICIRE